MNSATIEENLTAFFIGLHIGSILLKTGRYQKAIELLKECLVLLNTRAVRVTNVFYYSIYIRLLNACRLVSDHKQAIQHGEKALAICRELGDREAEGTLYHTLGREYHIIGEYVKAKELFEKATVVCIETGTKKEEASNYRHIGGVYRSLGDYFKAKGFLEKAIQISREIGDKKGETTCYGDLGILFQCLGDHVKAKGILEKALAISIHTGHRKEEGRQYGNLGAACYYLGEHANAKRFLEKAIEISIETGDRDGEQTHYNTLGFVCHSLGEFVKAKELLIKALEISIETGNRKEEGEDYGSIGIVYYLLGDFAKAKDFLEKALAISVKIGDKKREGVLYGKLGAVYQPLGEFLKAKLFLEKALAISVEIDDRSLKGAHYGELGAVYQSLGDFFKAKEFYENALAILIEIHDRLREGTYYCELGTVYQSLGEYVKAKDFLFKALAINIEIGEGSGECACYYNLGTVYQSLGEYVTAIEFYEKALAIKIEIGEKKGEEKVYCKLGTVYQSLGEYVRAKYFLEKALAISIQIGNRNGEGACYGYLGSAYHSLGEYAKAKELCEKALAIEIEIGNRSRIGAAYCNLGTVHESLDEYVKAKQCYKKSLEISIEIGDRYGEGTDYSKLGSVFNSLGEFVKAIEFHEKALAIKKEIGDKDGEGLDYASLGVVYHALGEYAIAKTYLKKGLALCVELGNIKIEFKIHCILARLHVLLHEKKEAMLCLHEAVKRFDDLRGFLGDHDQYKIHFADKNSFPYDLLSAILCDVGNIKEGLCVSELGRARALADLMSAQYSNKRPHTSRHLTSIDIEGMMQNENSTCTCLYISFTVKTIVFWIITANQNISFREIHIDAFTAANKCPDDFFQDLVLSLANQSYRHLRSLLEEKCEDRSLFAFYQTNANFEAQTEERHASSSLGDENYDEQEQEQPLRVLYKMLTSPVADLLDTSEIIIVPERSLYKVPFAALKDENGRHLSDKFRIRLIPSLTALKLIQDSPADYHSQTGVLIVGDPDVGLRQICPLPSAREEAKMIGRLLGVRPFLRREATKQVVLQGMQSVSLIHIAAHGDSQRGEIALAPVRPTRKIIQKEDFMLTMSDISEVQLRTKLVVLSCCHSFRGEVSYAEGVVGIARAFLGSGARSVLVSLWAVEDKATKAFMCQFYKHLSRGESVSECLQQAMKWMRESQEFCAVNQWAPFVLVGDNVTFNFEELTRDQRNGDA